MDNSIPEFLGDKFKHNIEKSEPADDLIVKENVVSKTIEVKEEIVAVNISKEKANSLKFQDTHSRIFGATNCNKSEPTPKKQTSENSNEDAERLKQQEPTVDYCSIKVVSRKKDGNPLTGEGYATSEKRQPTKTNTTTLW